MKNILPRFRVLGVMHVKPLSGFQDLLDMFRRNIKGHVSARGKGIAYVPS